MDSVSAAYPVPVPLTRIIGLDVLRVLAAACALPIYCVHVLFIQGVQAVAHKLGFGSSLTLDALTLLVTITGSFLFGWLLQRFPTTYWFVALHR